MSEGTVTSADAAAKRVPKAFKELKKEELVAAANAFGASPEGSKETIIADLAEMGVTWEDYATAFLVEKPEEPVDDLVVSQPEEEPLPEAAHVATADEQIALPVEQKYLVKMIRENPSFEFKGYKFTQDRPYAVMNAQDAQTILSSEDGFRQAFPAELEEFYDRA